MNDEIAELTSTETLPAGRDTRGLKWLHIFVEFAAIVFGVLLAFGLAEWRGSVKEARAVANAEDSIREELRANFDIVLNVRDYHKSQYISARRTQLSDGKESFDYRGFAAPNFSRAALDASIASGRFSGIEAEDARKLIQYYNELDDITKTEARYGLAGALQRQDGYEPFLRFVADVFSDFLYAEDDFLFKIAPEFDVTPGEGWWREKPKIDAELREEFLISDGSTKTSE